MKREIKKETRKAAIFTAAACILLSGCGIGIAIPGNEAAVELSRGFFNEHSTYFDRYSSRKNENICRVRGTIHQAADDQNGGLTCVTAEGGSGSLMVTGSMDCRDGNIKLIYVAPDGAETLIAEGTDRKLDAQIDVAEGEGGIRFASDGKSAVCAFDIKMEAGENVNFSGDMEEGESPEDIESMEGMESPEDAEPMESPERAESVEGVESTKDAESQEGAENSEGTVEAEREHAKKAANEEKMDHIEALNEIAEPLDDIGIEEIEDNWPESIRYHADGLYADPMTVTFQVDKPVTVSLACKTRDGKLRLKLAGPEGSGRNVLIDETNPDGAYTVDLDSPGEYQVIFYARSHVGSIEIVPVEE